jgi:regulator of protease activity HflC (stomatin/prohibitin superfamily)
MQLDHDVLIAFAIIPAITLAIVVLCKWLLVTNPERHEALRLRFGKLRDRIERAGIAGSRLAPQDRWISVSRQWDERIFRDIESNDSQGTMVKVVLRVTFRIADANRALFSVDDSEQALESSTVHEAAAAIAGKDRALFLRNAPELATALTERIRSTMAAYGIEIRDVRILDVEFRPEVARQLFETVAARLEIAKGAYQERGRTDAAMLLARTEEHVAELEARAKTENAKAVGRAYQELRQRQEVFAAYEDLYRLTQLDPSRVISFDGFDEGALSTAALVESDLERELVEPARRNGHSTHA